MRRLWLILLTAFALVATGYSSALAAEACPMMQATSLETAHDCCPDEGSQKNHPSQQHDRDGCMMGMSCRTAPAIALTLAPIALPNATILMSAPRVSEPAKLGGPPQELFRPPRTI
jgi:hypothetical protein